MVKEMFPAFARLNLRLVEASCIHQAIEISLSGYLSSPALLFLLKGWIFVA